jgi:uncharacterized damage-inducible protein DinB
MDVNDLRDLFEYNAWANQQMLEACALLSTEQFTRDMKSSFASIRDTLVHTLGGEMIWLGRLRGEAPVAFPNPAGFPDCASVQRNFCEIDAGLVKYTAALTPESLGAEIAYKTTTGTPYTGKPASMLQHLANHGTYHRGQVTTMLRQLGAKAVSTDLMRYRRE